MECDGTQFKGDRQSVVGLSQTCCLSWCLQQLQGETALSSAESECTGLSYASWEVIPIMELLKKMRRRKVKVATTAETRCKVFEDNSGALEMAKVHKCRPGTKHLWLHHFCSHVESKEATVHPIDTSEQLADHLTKPLPLQTLQHLREKVMRWQTQNGTHSLHTAPRGSVAMSSVDQANGTVTSRQGHSPPQFHNTSTPFK